MLLRTADQWLTYLGHFHPVVVHLPIGILFIVFLLELPFVKKKKPQQLDQAVSVILAAGCITALLSCLFGWLLSREGSYDDTTLMLHQWMGIAVAVISGICWSVKKRSAAGSLNNKSYIPLLISLFIALLLTGHWGGSMTHGEDYLTAALTNKEDTSRYIPKRIDNVNEAFVYADLVQNILADKCYSCHSAKKVKGGLRVDDEKLLFKGGKHGLVIEPGKPDASELIIRMLLPQDDDKRMPPKKQKAITQQELALLQWWILNGADTKKKVKDIASTPDILPVLNSFGVQDVKDSSTISVLSAIFDKELPAVSQKDIESLTSLGVIVSPVAKNKNLLEISCVNYAAFDDSKMPLLVQLSENIVSLKLDNTAITDMALDKIAGFTNLVRLNLAHTNISETGIKKLNPLSGLEYLNLVGTKVNDEGLLSLAKLPSIKHIYCWNSLVTTKTIKAINEKKTIIIAEADLR